MPCARAADESSVRQVRQRGWGCPARPWSREFARSRSTRIASAFGRSEQLRTTSRSPAEAHLRAQIVRVATACGHDRWAGREMYEFERQGDVGGERVVCPNLTIGADVAASPPRGVGDGYVGYRVDRVGDGRAPFAA